ncbi:MAG: heterodisulfide reductase-related iron-sulfur binding cluster, partial [Syntrophothermus sp.]
MNFGYYPGCSLSGTGREFDKSLKEVLKVLDVKLDEVKDWSCCGASSAHVTSHFLSIALPARNLILAKEQNLENVVAPCAACYNRLLGAQEEMNSNPILKEKVESAIEKKYTNHLNILNLVDLFNNIGLEKVKEKVKYPLKNINAACYYGCLLVRPNSLTKFDDA